jgi:RecB family endonuclease NucS
MTTEVGEMDLLLQGTNGELIVVELKKSGTDRTIGQILRYMGWVTHMAKASFTPVGNSADLQGLTPVL